MQGERNQHQDGPHSTSTHSLCPSPLRQEATEHKEQDHQSEKQVVERTCKTAFIYYHHLLFITYCFYVYNGYLL